MAGQRGQGRQVPGWLRAVQVFEYLGLAVGAILIVTGLAPGLGLAVALVSLAVAVVVQVRVSAIEGGPD
ncbi:MAG TPA: hypothetical protein VM433_13215 [Mycobacteriales bacterium]|nr:hypothetical protein [Mycobacteriales bacterium]